jgi:AraC-like DNA-binding protein
MRFVSEMALRQGVPDVVFHSVDFTRVLHPDYLEPVLQGVNLGRALRLMSQNVKRQNTGLRLWYAITGDRVQLCAASPFPRDYPGYAISETRILRLAEGVVKAYAGEGFLPSRVLMSARRRDLRFDVERAFGGVPVYTERRFGAIEFDRRLLAERRRTDAILSPDTFQTTAVNRELPSSLSDTLVECLVPYLSAGYPHVSMAAELVCCSVRTLQRRLHAEGTHYSEVVEDARRRAATRALLETNTGLAEIAAKIGYSEQSAFTRAFRRWTGTTPNRYRACAGNQENAR